MTAWMLVAVAASGGLGAVARYLVGRAIPRRSPKGFPWSTFAINVSGSFLLGAATGLAIVHVLPDEWRVIIGTGFLGGYTTFSTASTETVELARHGRLGLAAAYGIGMLATALAAAGVGLWIAHLT